MPAGAGRELLAAAAGLPGGRELAALADEDTALVGGAVRDLLLGRRPRELDVVVAGDAHEFAERAGRAARGRGPHHRP